MSSSGETPFRGANFPCGLRVLWQKFDFLLFIFPLELRKTIDPEHAVSLLSEFFALSRLVTASNTDRREGKKLKQHKLHYFSLILHILSTHSADQGNK